MKVKPHLYLYFNFNQIDSFENFDETIQIFIDENQLKLIIVDTDKEIITKWIN